MLVQSAYPYDETRVQREAHALVERGHEVHVICFRHTSEPRVEIIDGVTVYRLNVGKKHKTAAAQFQSYLVFWVGAFFKLTSLHLKKRFDIVQVHNLPDFLVFAAIVPRLTGSRIVLDIHDLMPEFYCSKFGASMNSFGARLLKLQERWACGFAHQVITVTDLWRKTLAGRSVPEAKCVTVMNLADPEYFTRKRNTAEEQSYRPFRILYHGTIVHRYGVDVLLCAIKRVERNLPGIQLRVHGRGDYLEELQRMVQYLDFAPGIVEVTSHFLPADVLAEMIQSADIAVIPYRRDVFTDGILPTKLLEYAAMGVPCIATRTLAMSHYFGDDAVEFFEDGDVDNLAEHIRRLYFDTDRRKQLVRNCERFSSVYNWSIQKQIYTGSVEKLAA